MHDKSLPELFFHLLHAMKSKLHQELEGLGIEVTPLHMWMLKKIATSDSCTAQALSVQLGRDKAQITRLVNGLLASELVTRTPNPNDKRSQILLLTDKGEGLVSKMKEINDKLSASMTQGFNDEDKAKLERLMAGVLANLHKS